MCEILELLAAALQEFPSFQHTLLLDTCRCHVSDVVTAKAAALNIWLVPVPAGLTHLLQPLDVYVFAGYKRYLREVYRELRSRAQEASPEAWLKFVFEVCTTYLTGHAWAPAFAQVGLGPNRSALSHDLLQYFPHGTPSRQGPCLTGAELAKLLPKGRNFLLLHWVRAPAGRRRALHVR